MISYTKNKSLKFGFNNDIRLKRLVENIAYSVVLKGGSIVTNFLLVSITLNYIKASQYGLWITISSMVTWLNFLDIGIGNGLKNKITAAIAKKEFIKAKEYISTTYGIMILMSMFLLTVFELMNSYIDWNIVLAVPENLKNDINDIIEITITAFFFQFILQNINTILIAIHKSSQVSLINFLGQFFVLISIFLLKYNVPGDLKNLIWILVFAPNCVLFIANIYYFTTILKDISPSIFNLRIDYVKHIVGTGSVFFVLQIGAIMLFQTNSYIIAKLFGPIAVTQYTIVFKLFSVTTMIINIIMIPYWSAFAEAEAKKDFIWMKKNVKALRLIWLGTFVVGIIVLIFSKQIISIWINEQTNIDKKLLFSMFMFTVISNWMTVHTYFLNGVNKIKLQFYLVIICAATNVIIAVNMGKNLGISGIVLVTGSLFLVLGLVLFMQTQKVLKQEAKGIWNK